MAARDGRLSLSLTDNRGGRGTFMTHVTVDDTLTIGDANTAIAGLKTVYDMVGNASIESGTFTLVNKAIAAAGDADSDVSAGAVFDFSNASNPSTYGQWVPSFKDSLILPGGFIDITAGANATFVAALIGAVLGGNYANAQYIANLAGLDAFLSSRKRNKRIR